MIYMCKFYKLDTGLQHSLTTEYVCTTYMKNTQHFLTKTFRIIHRYYIYSIKETI